MHNEFSFSEDTINLVNESEKELKEIFNNIDEIPCIGINSTLHRNGEADSSLFGCCGGFRLLCNGGFAGGECFRRKSKHKAERQNQADNLLHEGCLPYRSKYYIYINI